MSMASDERRAKWIRIAVIAIVIIAVLGWITWYNFFRTLPQEAWVEKDLRNHFLYGSIGQEAVEGVPYWIFMILPKVFPEYLPAPGGYASLGMSWEPGPPDRMLTPDGPPHEMPMGVTKKTVGFERAGLNCAFCHVARVRLTPDQPIPMYFPGGPSHVFRVQDYQWFLFRSASDPRFNSSVLMAAIAGVKDLSWREKILYRYILIPFTRRAILQQKAEFEWQFTHNRPLQGPGRVDPFNPVRFRFFHEPDDGSIGNADIPSIWNQRARVGGWLHWDGLARVLEQVEISSAIGDGARDRSLDLESLKKVKEYLMNLPPPKYPLPINAALAAQGEPVYKANCAQCHEPGGPRTLHPIDLKEVGTDPHRSESWTQSQVDSWKKMAAEYKRKYGATWTFDSFEKNNGYVAVLLDGVWLRGPYLHNGSVPSLRDLLNPPDQRPKTFYRGYDVFDGKNVGFVSNVASWEGQPFFLYDTSLPGNGNNGHLYGTTLPANEKEALLEYLKTQ
jgi:hypothetical protein